MSRRAGAFTDAVGAVWIDHELKWLVICYEFINKALSALIVDIIVSRTVNDKEVALKLFGERNWRAFAISVRIVLRCAHVPLLINRVVQTCVGNRRHRHAERVELRISEKHVERHRSTTAPAPDSDPGGVYKRHGGELFGRSGLVVRSHDADLFVDRFAPLAPL